MRAHLFGLMVLVAAAPALAGSQAVRPSPVLQAPIVVKPPTIEVPAQLAPPVAVTPPPPPVAIQRPPVLTSCDAGGCWDSNGTRLNRAGPALVGPGGPCVVSGSMVQQCGP